MTEYQRRVIMQKQPDGSYEEVSADHPFQVYDPKVGNLISYDGETTADGAADGSTLVCSALTSKPDYDGNLVIITSGDYEGQAGVINGATTGGTVTPIPAFGGQIVSGITFIIVGIRIPSVDIASLLADVGDASASTLGSLYAILGDPATDLATSIATLLAGGGAIAAVAQATGTFAFDETNAAEQTAFTLAIAARAKIGGIWLDMSNVTQNTDIRVKHQIDGANYRTFTTLSWLNTDDDGVLVLPFTAYRNIRVTLQCGGGGVGNINVPYAVV